ncbi:MAG TPA: peptidase M14 [Chromatiales bacterium]|nr:peptidase M14 [Chromatiales bacterium]
MLHERDRMDSELLAAEARDLDTILGGPALIHLEGRRTPVLFVSVLMHGNETVGWEAVRGLLRRYAMGNGRYDLPRAMSLFIGNVAAAAQGERKLEGQPDYNRVWPGSELPFTPEHAMMRQVVDTMEARGVFASVDVHNNTGFNPHYACVNVLDDRFLQLAALFSRTVVYFLRPKGVQSQAMARLCPAVTLECGKVGQSHGVAHAMDYLDACLHMAEIPAHPVANHDIDLFHTVAQVKVPEGVSFGFDDGDYDIRFASDLDRLNFRELPPGTLLGEVRDSQGIPLDVRDEQGGDVVDRFFQVENGCLETRLPVMPSMLTRDATVIRQDCLCYLMERYNDHLTN